MSETSSERATGVSRIASVFERASGESRGVLMPFVVGGHPAGASLPDIVEALSGAGAGIIEIGFPFSDPIADGGVIAQAMHETLSSGRSLDALLADARAAADRVDTPLVAMVSASLVHRRGGDRFIGELASAGFAGVIVPDLTLEESGPYRDAAVESGLAFSLLVAPATPADRASAIARSCTGFVYLLARAGITGERRDAPDVAARVEALRGEGVPPVAVGFGISTADHVATVVRHADAAIVGSALVRRLDAAADPVGEASSFCHELAAGLQR